MDASASLPTSNSFSFLVRSFSQCSLHGQRQGDSVQMPSTVEANLRRAIGQNRGSLAFIILVVGASGYDRQATGVRSQPPVSRS
jgi:hypothetical protein